MTTSVSTTGTFIGVRTVDALCEPGYVGIKISESNVTWLEIGRTDSNRAEWLVDKFLNKKVNIAITRDNPLVGCSRYAVDIQESVQ